MVTSGLCRLGGGRLRAIIRDVAHGNKAISLTLIPCGYGGGDPFFGGLPLSPDQRESAFYSGRSSCRAGPGRLWGMGCRLQYPSERPQWFGQPTSPERSAGTQMRRFRPFCGHEESRDGYGYRPFGVIFASGLKRRAAIVRRGKQGERLPILIVAPQAGRNSA